MRLREHFTNLLLPAGLVGVPVLAFVLFGDPETKSLGFSDPEVTRITDQIRIRTREKWQERIRDLDAILARMEAIRAEKFAHIRTQGQGHAYLDRFQALAQDLQAKTPDDPPGGSLWHLHETARFREQQITDCYREILGAQYAISLQVPPSDALGLVQLVQPERIPLDREVLADDVRISGRDKSLDAFKKNVINGASSLDAMVDAGRKTLAKAREGLARQETPLSWMTEGDRISGSDRGSTLRPDETADDGIQDTGGFDATPGRVVEATQGARADWMYLDKWYVMGPFENRFRSNREAAFLPETVVDLDHVTLGKDGRELRWEYWVRSSTANKPRIEPTFAPRMCVYYAWTEVYVHQAGRYYVSMGSDDYGKMWLNGDLKWASKSTPKQFRANEQQMEMDFKQGVNQILFRCENAGGTMGWSVSMCTMPADRA